MEIEIKLEPGSAASLADLPMMLGLGVATHDRLVSTYFDTIDGRLGAMGITLRIRWGKSGLVQTIKQADGAAAGYFTRREWEQRVDDDMPVIAPGGPVARALRSCDDPLAPRYRILVDRACWLIDDGASVIELALDRGIAGADSRMGDSTRDGTAPPFAVISEIELELKSGDPAAIFALARRIAAIIPVRIGVLSKAARATRLLAPSPPPGKAADRAETVALTPAMPVADAFRAITHQCIRHFRLNEDRLRADNGAQAVHQARVAIRRLRSALVAFRPVLGGDRRARQCNNDLRWIAGHLGSARDLDMLIPRMTRPATRARLEQERERAYARARQAVDTALARGLWLDMVEWLALGEWAQHKVAHKTVDDFAPHALDRLHDRLLVHRHAIAGADDEARHEARKAAKKLRYAIEFFDTLYQDDAWRKARKAYLAPLRELQEYLGDLNDIATMPATFAALGLDPVRDGPGEDHTDRRSVLIVRANEAMHRLRHAPPFWR